MSLAALSLLAACPARAQLASSAQLQASSATITGDVGVGATSASSRLDVRGGRILMELNPVEVRLSSAVQSGSVTTGSVQVWSAVTGASCSFTLSRAMAVRMQAHGAASIASGAHCGMRFVVDSVGQGNVSWGDVIFFGNGAAWGAWAMERETSLTAGNHTISLQQVSDVASGCSTNTETYSAARLWIYGR